VLGKRVSQNLIVEEKLKRMMETKDKEQRGSEEAINEGVS